MLLMATKDGKAGVMDVHGKIKIPLLYDEILEAWNSDIDSIYLVRQGGKWGLVQFGKVLLPCEYDAIASYSHNRDGFYLTKDSKQGFYVYSAERKVYNIIIPCKYVDVGSQLYWVSPPDVNRALNYGRDPIKPYFLLWVNIEGRKNGFIDLKGNEFFRD